VAESNNPPILVELTPELADFVVQNCDSNLSYALGIIMEGKDTLPEDTLRAIVAQTENFKALKAQVLKAKEPL